jgi:hypothetical protein
VLDHVVDFFVEVKVIGVDRVELLPGRSANACVGGFAAADNGYIRAPAFTPFAAAATCRLTADRAV